MHHLIHKPFFFLSFVVLISTGILFGANPNKQDDKLNVIVSVPPQIYFVKKIAKDFVNVNAMVPDGRSPETYEPLPSQIKLIKNATLYLGIGMEFEKAWKNRFMGANPNLNFVDLSDGLPLRKFTSEEHHMESASSHHHHDGFDPHIWLSIHLAKQEAKKIAQIFEQIDPIRAEFYQTNLKEFLSEINELDSKIRAIFARPNAQKSFVVYHPAFGYLAHEYNLEEIALENNGKSPKTKQMIALRKIIQNKKIHVVYIQPEFSKKRILALANELKLKIKELDPLAKDWANNLLFIASQIASNGE